jgi:hypothetical protein
MHLRRTLLAVSLAGALTTVVPATAADVSARSGLRCEGLVVGFDSAQRLVMRTFENRAVLRSRRADTAVPFTPSSMSFVYGEHVDETTHRNTMATLTAEGRPRVVRNLSYTDSDSIVVTTEKMLNPAGFNGRLLADSWTNKDFIVDRAGNLKRWQMYRDTETGRLFWDDPILLSRDMARLKTLTFHSRYTIGGVKKDVLWATTKAGALLQLQIPVGRPKALRVTTVKRSGFKKVTALSSGWCNNRPFIASLVVIEPGENRARWITVRDQARPKASNFVDHGRVARDLNWRLHATF